MISQEEFKKLLKYDPITGEFTWLVDRGSVGKGSAAGWMDDKGYRNITVDGYKRGAHRWAFLYMEGEIPTEVDHVNNVPTDNRWCNLRACCRSGNTRNTRLSKNNTTGVKGVSWHNQKQKYAVRLMVDGKYRSFGLYSTLVEAERAARSAREKYHGEYYNHGTE